MTLTYKTLYCDMDGVLADFDTGLNKHVPSYSVGVKLTKDHHEEIANIDHNWWINIPPIPDAKLLWNAIKRLHPEILSAWAPWDEVRSKAGKLVWMRNHFGVLPSQINLVSRKEKRDYAMSGGLPNVLIDDYDKNIAEFTAAGGVGIHHKSARDTIMQLKSYGIL